MEGARTHALVIGGSVSGLAAAAALARHFSRVTIVERDPYPDRPEVRKGTPQARHVHVLLKQGEATLERFLPGLFDELAAAGGQRVDTAGDARWHYFGNWKARFRSGIEMISQSRPLLEHQLRRRVLALGNVAFKRGDAVELLGDVRRVVGARVRETAVAGTPTHELRADLVVDASGRGSRMPIWLERLGASAPSESELAVDVGYASREYRRTDASRDWTALLCHPRHPDTHCGVLLPIEGGRWLLTLVGWFGNHPAGDEAGFLGFAKRLATPELYEAVKDAEPLSEIALHRFPSNRRRHYERLDDLPDGVAIVGDATCSFNPVYAQGMTAGALGAHTLDERLTAEPAGTRRGFSLRFQRALARRIDVPWLVSTSEDFRNPELAGARPAWMPLLTWYTARIHELSWSDELAARRFLEVMHLLRGPSALFHPALLARVLARSIRRTR